MQKYPSINGLRALSILSVIISHLDFKQGFFQDWKEDNHALNLLKFFLQDAQFGVNVFFVLSGFLITSLLIEEERRTQTVSLKKFYIRRTLRIFPAYYFVLLVYFVLQIENYLHLSDLSWITALTFTKQFYRTEWFTAHFWSLSVEESFYLFWPLVFMGGDRFRKRAAVFLIILVPVIRTFLYFHPIAWIDELMLFTRIDAIAMGCFFAIYKDAIVAKLSPYWTAVFVVSAVAVVVLHDLPIHFAKIGLGFIFIPLGLTHGTIANVLIALILMYSVFGPKGLWFRLLNTRVMDAIGLLSYSLYLWQQFFISERVDWINRFPQNVVLIFLTAIGSYYLIEKPFLRLKKKFSSEHAATKVEEVGLPARVGDPVA